MSADTINRMDTAMVADTTFIKLIKAPPHPPRGSHKTNEIMLVTVTTVANPATTTSSVSSQYFDGSFC